MLIVPSMELFIDLRVPLILKIMLTMMMMVMMLMVHAAAFSQSCHNYKFNNRTMCGCYHSTPKVKLLALFRKARWHSKVIVSAGSGKQEFVDAAKKAAKAGKLKHLYKIVTNLYVPIIVCDSKYN